MRPAPAVHRGSGLVTTARLALTKGRVIRVFADALMVNCALFMAFAIRFLLLLAYENPERSATLFTVLQMRDAAFLFYPRAAACLTLLAVAVFPLSGLYAWGRASRPRRKAVMVLEAVTLTYVLFGFLSYLRITPLPRGVWLLGWALTLALLWGMRRVVTLWIEIARREDRLLRQKAEGPIRRVLVIGGAGYLGAALVRRLLARGDVVRVLDLLLYGDRAMIELRSHPRFEFVQGDFRNIETVVRCMQDVDAVVHLGAIVGDPAGDLEPEITHEVNVVATRLIAEVARGYGVRRFLFTSTCGVYGPSQQVVDERSSTHALSLYAKSKLASEALLLAMADEGFSPVILRLGTLYGLSYRPRFDLVVNLLTGKALREKEIVLMDGDQWRLFLHVEDAARAIARCLEVSVDLIAGEIFNVGSTQENYQLAQVAGLISDLVPGTRVRREHPGGARSSYRVSCEKIAQRVEFRTTRTVRDGVLEIIDAIESGAISDYAAPEYSNFQFLSAPGEGLAKTITPRYAHLIEVPRDARSTGG